MQRDHRDRLVWELGCGGWPGAGATSMGRGGGKGGGLVGRVQVPGGSRLRMLWALGAGADTAAKSCSG